MSVSTTMTTEELAAVVKVEPETLIERVNELAERVGYLEHEFEKVRARP